MMIVFDIGIQVLIWICIKRDVWKVGCISIQLHWASWWHIRLKPDFPKRKTLYGSQVWKETLIGSGCHSLVAHPPCNALVQASYIRMFNSSIIAGSGWDGTACLLMSWMNLRRSCLAAGQSGMDRLECVEQQHSLIRTDIKTKPCFLSDKTISVIEIEKTWVRKCLY